MTITLTVTAQGQITVGKEVLEHLGVRPGGRVDVDLLENGQMRLQARRGKADRDDLRPARRTGNAAAVH